MAETKNDDDDMTPQEREKWLRDHGVLIETPQDRLKEEHAHSLAMDGVCSIVEQLSGVQLQEENNIQFVFVPQDDTKPLQTVQLPASIANQPGDSLPNYVKAQFADSKSIDTGLLQEQATKQFAGGDLKQLADTKLNAASMNAAAAQGSVETFPLVHPADTNGFCGVYIYLDEVGLLKKLPNNTRASQLAAACGFHPPPNFYGDVFVGRVKSKPVLQNVNFVAGVDTDGTSEWMKRAVSENLSWQQEMNRVTGKTGETQPAQAGTDGTVAEEDNFTWTQDDDEVELTVPFPAVINKRLVKVVFFSRAVRVMYDGKEHLAVKPLYGGIDVDGCTWTIDGDKLVITCEKVDGGSIWPRLQS